jgi:hypothetical protein
VLTVVCVTVGLGLFESADRAHADTPTGQVTGEGGDALTPIMIKLLHDDSAQLSPDFGSYTNVDIDQAISDFVGTAPGTFNADFIVSERALTTAESAMAKTNGRSYAYVPIASVPIALMTLVPVATYSGGSNVTPAELCQHVPLDLNQLDGLYGQYPSPTPPILNWGDPRLSCTLAGAPADPLPPALWANLDPTMENFGMMTLLDSTTASTAIFEAGLVAAQKAGQADTTSTTPSELWPFPKVAYPGGDQALLGKLIGLDAKTDTPYSTSVLLGSIMPVASDWTGDPLGVAWNLPTAAVQNAANAYVAPSAASALAAQSHITMSTTSNPETDNLVQFNPSTTDTDAYNSYLMMQSYLVVPTNGLPPDKALALAQLVRFALGGTGQADITAMGAAPATPDMVTAGLKVAQELDAEAVTSSSTTTTTAPTCSSTTSTSTSSTSSTSTSSTSSTTTTTAPTCTTTTTSSTTSTTSTTDDSTTTGTTGTSTTGAGSSDSGTGSSDSGTGSGTGSSSGTGSGTGAAGGSSGSSDPSGTSGGGAGASGSGGSSGDLAFTGINPVPLAGLGVSMFVVGEVALILLRRRRLPA